MIACSWLAAAQQKRIADMKRQLHNLTNVQVLSGILAELYKNNLQQSLSAISPSTVQPRIIDDHLIRDRLSKIDKKVLSPAALKSLAKIELASSSKRMSVSFKDTDTYQATRDLETGVMDTMSHIIRAVDDDSVQILGLTAGNAINWNKALVLIAHARSQQSNATSSALLKIDEDALVNSITNAASVSLLTATDRQLISTTADSISKTLATTAADSAVILSITSATIDKMSEAQIAMLQRALERTTEIVNHHRLVLVALYAVIAMGLLFVPYIIIAFYKSMMIDVRRLKYAIDQIGQGNLRVSCKVRAHDEMSDIATSLAVMAERISGIIATVGSEAALLADVGSGLNAHNQSMAARIEQHASALRETVTGLAGLTENVQTNAAIAESVNRQAVELNEIATHGAAAMLASVKTTEEIHQNSQRMNDFVGIIDGIAFQTNLLALNAAVESARAGVYGRGFGVVAAEVRALAQRTAENSREIRQLIKSSSSQVETGLRQIKTAHEGIAKILNGCQHVSSKISQISASNADQSYALSEISSALSELDGINYENQVMIEQSIVNAENLQMKASRLTDSVHHIKMNQGMGFEAVELVQRAVECCKQSRTTEAFLTAVTDIENKFFDRDMYVFVLDKTGRYLAFGGNPAKVGTRVQDIPGVDGQGLLDNIMKQASKEPGWVEYQITNPSNGRVQDKMSYVVDIGNDLVIGCGVYKTLVTS